eukprot:CAMPEP_0168315588 /NCGR_PEP_ID=MMETSP0210-20121227/11851_1 /TAXON_ID=40633 /ORGANISM="Condylostoma magnum, Strain COL2" /LENGTH=46 /DNA_ID= /DNA_START= /DNA_END= /DNA_ORIENTATION=
MDLVKRLEMRDPMAFKDEFDIVTWADLPVGWAGMFGMSDEADVFIY